MRVYGLTGSDVLRGSEGGTTLDEDEVLLAIVDAGAKLERRMFPEGSLFAGIIISEGPSMESRVPQKRPTAKPGEREGEASRGDVG